MPTRKTSVRDVAQAQIHYLYDQMRLARSGLLWMEALADAGSPESQRLTVMINEVEDLASALAKQAEKRARRPAKRRATTKPPLT